MLSPFHTYSCCQYPADNFRPGLSGSLSLVGYHVRRKIQLLEFAFLSGESNFKFVKSLLHILTFQVFMTEDLVAVLNKLFLNGLCIVDRV